MPKGDGKTLESLYIELGLDLSQLQADFLAADKSVTENLGRLNRQQNTIKLRVAADVAGLDRFKDATQILEIQERGLNQQLALSKDKLSILEAAYRQVANNQNSSAMAVQRAEQAYQKARLEVAQLEQALKSLSAQKISVDTSRLNENISNLNSRIQHVRLQADIDTSKLQGTTAAFDAQKIHIAAVTKEIDLQRQKLIQLQGQMYKSAQVNGGNSSQTLNIKSNVLHLLQEIQHLKSKLQDLQNTNISLQVRADSLKQTEAAIHDNIARINAQIEHIRVKTDIDVSKLGAAASDFDKAKAHLQGLNRELDLQNQKLAEMRKALATSISSNGLGNLKTINLQTDIQKQIQAINQLEAKIKELNNVAPPKSNDLLSGYFNLKGDVAGKLNSITSAFANLNGATASADSAITGVLGVIGEMPHPVARAVTALAGLPIIFKGIENSLINMTRAAAASGDAVYVMSRGFQMSVADTGKFSTNAKVAGTDVNSLATAVKNVQRQIVKGGDDSRAAEWLQRYGESARDANGNLKNLNDMTFALSRALHKAQEEGKGSEFVLSVFRNISADDITAIEDWSDVAEQAATIVKNGLGNPALAHSVQGNLNALKVQEAQLNAAFTNALLPVANEIIPRVTERLGKMTQILADNKDIILAFGRDFAEVWGAVEATVDKVGEGLGFFAQLARDNRVVGKHSQKDIVGRYKDDTSIQNAKDLVEKEIAAGGYTDEDVKKLRSRNDLYLKEVRQKEAVANALWAARREDFAKQNAAILRKYADDDSIKTATDLFNKLTDAEKEAIKKTPAAFGSLQERVAALHPEFKKLQIEAAAAKKEVEELLKKPLSGADSSTIGQERHALGENGELIEQLRQNRKYEDNAATIRDKLTLNDYDFAKSELQRWLQEQLPRDAEQSLDKYLAVMKEFQARSEQIEQERADKLKEIRDSVDAADKTALQNKLDAIEKERQAWLKAGMDEAEATELAQKIIAKAYDEVNERIQEHLKNAADIEYGLTHSAFEKQLRDIEQWQEAQKEKAATAEEVQGIIANAAAKEAEAFESAMDRIRGKLQSLDDKIFAQEHSQYENDLRRIQQERLRYYEDFRKEGVLNAANQAKIERWYQNAVGDLNQRAKNGGDYTKSPEGSMQRGGNGIVVIGADQIIDDGKIKQSIGLIADESQERALLMQGLSQEARDRVNAIQAVKQLNDAQKQLAQQASGFQLIEGDKIVNQPTSPQVIEGGNVVSDVQQFGNALEQSTDPVQSLRDSARDAADAQKSLADSVKNLPPEYFKTLADGTQAVSEMQMRLTDSTMHLIDAQNNLANAFADLPTVNQSSGKNQPDGMMKLNYSTQALQDAQNRLSATTRDVDARLRDISDIPPQSQIAQNDSGWKFGIDYDTFKDVLLTGVGLAAPAAMTGVGTAAIPAIAAGTLGTAIAASIAKGSYDETMAAHEQANRLNALPEDLVTPLGNIDTNVQSILQQLQDTQSNGSDRFQEFFGALPNVEASVQDILLELQSQAESESADYFTPINSIDSNLQSVLQTMQDTQTNEGDRFQEFFGALPNIEASVQDILLTLQARAEVPNTAETNPQLPAQSETGSIDYSALLSGIDSKIETLIQGITTQETVSFETVITPLNNIAGIVQNILSALENRQPPQITVAPNNNVDLGGAYVFDNAMKKSLVDDITSEIVNNITDAVRQATSTSSYGYGV